MSRLAIGLGAALSLVAARSFPARADAPPTGRIAIDVVTVGGNGCLPGTVSVVMEPGNTFFDVVYSSYLAGVGLGFIPTDFRKNCQVRLVVRAPPGFAYAIAAVDYRALVSLVDGASGRLRRSFFFQGQTAPALVEHSFFGPVDDEQTITDSRDESDLVFGPCGEQPALVIATELRLSVGTSDPARTSSFMFMDWIDAAGGATTYHLQWKQCTAGSAPSPGHAVP